MEKEEQYIYDRYGKQNLFTVPDGYFDSLRTGLMQHATTTTTTKAIPLWKRWRGYVAAACLVGVVTVGLATYWGLKTTDVADTHVAVDGYATVDDDFSDDEYADYTMLDNDDIYSFLANN
ncbi:hypothetical protein [Leyella stercorea]|jgi:hypothetical protein|uniref:hypothetical protein n=1 Tax=Leyella stercorea TaxID=363265 RepID=UPI00266C13CD|nr:hypothetical protein [Leyella stercorea]